MWFISFLFSFKSNPGLKLIKLEIRKSYPIIWHHGIWDITRGRNLLTFFPTNLSSRKQVTKFKENNVMPFFLKQIVCLHVRVTCLSSKKRTQRPRDDKTVREQTRLCSQFTEGVSHSLYSSTLLLIWAIPLHA